MKTKIYIAFVAIMAVLGLVNTSTQAVAGTDCPSTGTLCATSADGTTYYKGGATEELQF